MKNVGKIAIIVVISSLIILGSLVSTRVIDKTLSIDKVKLIFDMPSIRDSIVQHQKDARYLPYRIRIILYNNSVYIYQLLRNIARFWSLNNINKIFLLANLYPLYFGFKSINNKKNISLICILGITFGSIVIGVNKMVDARSATWFMLPILGYLVFKGFNKIKMKIYLPMLVVSILMLL